MHDKEQEENIIDGNESVNTAWLRMLRNIDKIARICCVDSSNPTRDFLSSISTKIPPRPEPVALAPGIGMWSSVIYSPMDCYTDWRESMREEIEQVFDDDENASYTVLESFIEKMSSKKHSSYDIDTALTQAVEYQQKFSFLSAAGGVITFLSHNIFVQGKKQNYFRLKVACIRFVKRLLKTMNVEGANKACYAMTIDLLAPQMWHPSVLIRHGRNFIMSLSLEECHRFYLWMWLIRIHCEKLEYSLDVEDYIRDGIAEEYEALAAGVPWNDLISS